jgi:hypothetical protein
MASSHPPRLRAHIFVPTLTIVALIAVTLTVPTRAFTLEIPKRPTTFPLMRPQQAGEVVAWGDNSLGQTTVPPNLTNVIAIAAGANHNLAVTTDGTVVAWGDNTFGQCNVPQNPSGVVAVAGGSFHSLALQSNGHVVAWGTNDARIIVPSTLATAVAIVANDVFSAALKADGSVIFWGPAPLPVHGAFFSNVVSITALSQDVVALLDTGLAYELRGLSSLGNGITQIAAITGGTGTMLGVRTDGAIAPMYADLPVGLRAVAVTSSSIGYAALRSDGTVVVWGNGENAIVNPPLRLRGVIKISGGLSHFLALKLPSPPLPTTAVASAQIDHGFIVALNVLDGGEGYAQPPSVTITGGGGTGATATAQISRGVVTGFTMTSAGIGYTGTPTITIDPPPILPSLAIGPSRVNVVLQVVPGHKYQLESTDDLPNFSPLGAPFTAATGSITNEFTLSQTGQYFRVQEVP